MDPKTRPRHAFDIIMADGTAKDAKREMDVMGVYVYAKIVQKYACTFKKAIKAYLHGFVWRGNIPRNQMNSSP